MAASAAASALAGAAGLEIDGVPEETLLPFSCALFAGARSDGVGAFVFTALKKYKWP